MMPIITCEAKKSRMSIASRIVVHHPRQQARPRAAVRAAHALLVLLEEIDQAVDQLLEAEPPRAHELAERFLCVVVVHHASPPEAFGTGPSASSTASTRPSPR